MAQAMDVLLDAHAVRQAEIRVLQSLDDLITYMHDPAIYDALEFLKWDSSELTSLVDFPVRPSLTSVQVLDGWPSLPHKPP